MLCRLCKVYMLCHELCKTNVLSRSHEAPSVRQSRGSGLYDDVSLKHPSLDPSNQMLEDSEEQSVQDDPVLANRCSLDTSCLVRRHDKKFTPS